MTTIAIFIALIVGALAGAQIALTWAARNRDDR